MLFIRSLKFEKIRLGFFCLFVLNYFFKLFIFYCNNDYYNFYKVSKLIWKVN